jgi:hypothetical protein
MLPRGAGSSQSPSAPWIEDHPIGDQCEREIRLLDGNEVAHVAPASHRWSVDFLIET